MGVTVCVAVIPFLVQHLLWNVYIHQYMNLCPTDCLYLLHPLWTVSWKHGCPCVALYVCHNQPISGPRLCLECVHASVHQFMSTSLSMSASPPLNTFMETWQPMCGIVSLSQSHFFWSQTLVRMCTCISTCIYVHLTPHFILTPLCIITWKDVCPCIAQCEYFSKATSGPTLWLECVHASGHVFMSTWFPMSPSSH